MKIEIEHHQNQFNVALCSKEGMQPFLVIKGCRVMDGQKGRFISWPARKMDNGKWWNHVFASEGFATAVLEAYDASAPKQAPVGDKAYADQDIPF